MMVLYVALGVFLGLVLFFNFNNIMKALVFCAAACAIGAAGWWICIMLLENILEAVFVLMWSMLAWGLVVHLIRKKKGSQWVVRDSINWKKRHMN